MKFHAFPCISLIALLALASASNAAQTLEAQIDNTCAPWDGAALTVDAPLSPDLLFRANIWHPEVPAGGLTLDSHPVGNMPPGNASLCTGKGDGQFTECEPVTARIKLDRVKDGDTGSGTLYIEGKGLFMLNAHWKHTQQFCG